MAGWGARDMEWRCRGSEANTCLAMTHDFRSISLVLSHVDIDPGNINDEYVVMVMKGNSSTGLDGRRTY
jgi:hypothetical protein